MIKGRNRSPVGMGQRIGPPDDSPKGGMYAAASSSGYHRSFGRGGGRYRRGPPQLRLPPPPPPSKEDILMEAGRLAAEYLVAQGILPASSLPPPAPAPPIWRQQQQQNGGFQEQPIKAGQGERERIPSPRMSALDRLGSGDLKEQGGYGRRRYGEDYPPSSSRGRGKRMGNYATRWGGDSGWPPGGWTERSRRFDETVMEEDEEYPAPGYRRRWPDNHGSSISGGGGSGLSPTDGEVVVRRTETAGMDSDLDATDYGAAGEGGSVKAAGLSGAKEEEEESRATTTTSESNVNVRDDDLGDAGSNAVDVEAKPVDVVTVEVAGIIHKSADVEKKDEGKVELGSSMQEPLEETVNLGEEEELLRYCAHFGFPRKRRSALGNRGARKARTEVGSCSKASATTEPENQQEEPAIAEKKKMANEALKAEPEGENEVAVAVEYAREEEKGEIHNSNSSAKRDSDAALLCSDDECGNPSPAIEEKGISAAALPPSFPESSPVPHTTGLVVEASLTPGRGSGSTSLWPESSSSTVPTQVDSSKSLPVPEASPVASSGTPDDALAQKGGTNKRARDCHADVILREDGCGNGRDLNSKHFCGKQMADEGMADASDHKRIDETRLSWKTEAQPMETLEEDKQLLPSSFKICDLNLMGTPEVTEVPRHPVRERGSDTTAILQTGDVPSVEFGLSIGNDNRKNDVYAQNSNVNKSVQVIDLEDDSPVEPGTCDSSKPRNEAIYGLESFLDNPESAVDLPDIQDGYDHAITDLLGSDITSCPSVAADINALQPGMTLNGTEGMAGDDDSIYVSLSELPIEFVNIWDHSHQEYGKYF